MVVNRKRKLYKLRRESSQLDYKVLYRFSKEHVEWLAEHFLGHSEETRGGALTNEEKMRIFLRYVGDPGFQSGVGEDIGVCRSTVSKTFFQVLTSIEMKADYWIKFPTNVAEMQEAQAKWQERFTFPYAIGAVDCTHVQIKKPHIHGDEYINRKGVPSINVQATCNGKEQFTSVDASWPGSVHDSRIWRNSDVCSVMTRRHGNALLLGDVGYGISPWLMTPFQNAPTPEQRAYNACITRERVVIERCFGQVKQRFPILQSKIRLATERVPSVILCCFILHNVAKHIQDEDFEIRDLNDGEDFNVPVEHDGIRIRERGQQRRDEIATAIYGLQGE